MTDSQSEPAAAEAGKRPLRVAFLYSGGRLARIEAARKGKGPVEFFYGAIELEKRGWDIRFYCLDQCSYPKLLAAALDYCAPRRFRPPKTGFGTIFKVMGLCSRLNDCDCVVATVNEIALAAAICSRLGLLRTRIVGIFCGMLNYPYNPSRIRMVNRLLRRARPVLFGEGEREPFASFFGIPIEEVAVNQFGVDASFWTPGPESNEFVLSVGNDGRRDYRSLVAAAGLIKSPIRIVTNHPMPEDLPANVTWLKGGWHDAPISDSELRDLYRRASCVVIPLSESEQPSGQSVALQAMACGRPVVITRTDGLWSRDTLRDEENILFAKAGDPRDLGEKVATLLKDPVRAKNIGERGRETALAHGDSARFAEGIGHLCEAGPHPAPPR